ncbi:MAG: DnaJ C-terminal domain-containing protein [Candidatus Accumulibacter sp. UW26]|jgi:molecular chaperone DnaJ
MSDFEDPFSILGVRPEASQEELKRAYRRLAMQWHPDRNPSVMAESEFKRVQAAYELCLDPLRLAEWQQAQAARATNGTSERRAAARSADDLTQILTLSLEEAARGCRRNIDLMHRFRCPACRGSGRLQHRHSVACHACSGCGRLVRKGGGTSLCEACSGRGYLRETACPDCAASGWRQELRTLMVTVPPGMLDGERLRLARQAPLPADDAAIAGDDAAIAGDVYLEIRLAAHPLFALCGRDLHCQVPVSIFRLLAGGRVEVPTLQGTTRFALSPSPQLAQEHRLPGLGYPDKRGRAAGDLVVHLQRSIPEAVGSEDVALLEKLEERLADDLDRRAPQLAAWERQMRTRRQSAVG